MRTIATIRTAIQIQDGLSQAFRSMNIAMQATINSFEHLQEASGNAVDTASIELARRELARVDSAFNDIEREIEQADQAQQNLNNQIQNGADAALNLLNAIGAIVGTYFTIQGAQGILQLSDEMTNIDARLNLVLGDDSTEQQLEQLQQQIFDASKRSFASYGGLADLVGKLGMNAPDAFGNTDEIVAFAELLSKQFGIAGTSASNASNATIQLVQALGSGVLRGDELNSIFEQAPDLIHSIADYMEVPIGAIREMASNGELTAEIVKASMFAAADDINNKFNSMPVTFEQIWTNFKNDALWAFQGVLKEINNIANSEKFNSFVNDVSANLYTLANIAMHLVEVMSFIGGFIYDNWSIVAPVVGTATAAIALYGAALLTAKMATIASTIWLGLKTLALGLMTNFSWAGVQATMSLTAAQWGLNAALMANPIFIIVLAIIALIGVIYLAVAAINYFAGTSISATGIVAGVFMAALAIIANMFIYLYNIAVEVFSVIYNIAVDVSEGLVNLFSGDLSSITRMFVNLADTALSALQSIARGMDFVLGTNLADGVAGWRNSLADWSIETLGENRIEFNRMDSSNWQLKTLDVVKAYNTGYNWGENLANGLDLTNSAQSEFDPSQALKDAMAGLEDSGKDTAGNTKKMADSVDMLEDDLKYLRDLSEREAINRYTTGEIKIDMKNENYINDEMDIDGIIDRFAEKLEEAVEVVAEGGAFDV